MHKRPPLGIIAGGGRLPAQLIDYCQSAKRECFVIAFEDTTDPAILQHVPHAVVRLGAVGEALSYLKQAGARELVLAGRVRRPSFSALRPDLMGAKLLARMGTAFFSGDDAVLRAVMAFLEEEGFAIVGAHEILSGLTAPVGIVGKIQPDVQAKADIAKGLTAAKALGALDIGQSVIVENGYVLGVEAAEGTDQLIERCKLLKRETKGGVLVKTRKTGQDTRADLPSIGPATVEKMAACGFAGIAVEASGSLLLDREQLIARADALGIFIAGVEHE